MKILSDSEVILGEWWLPERPDQRLAGNLTIEDHNINLELMDVWDRKIVDLKCPPLVIHGITESGEEASLLDCRFKFSVKSLNAKNYQRACLRCNWAVLGTLIRDEKEPVFSGVNLISQGFEEWSWQPQSEHLFLGKTNIVGVRHRIPESLQANIAESVHLSIRYSLSGPKITAKGVEYRNNPFLSLEFDQTISFNAMLDYVRSYLSFLRFALSTYMPLNGVTLIRENRPKPSSRNSSLLNPILIAQEPDFKLDRFHMRFTVNSIKARFCRVMTLWYSMDEITRYVVESLMESLYRREHFFSHSNFINLVSALEAHCRSKYNGKNLRLRELLSRLIASFPDSIINDLGDEDKFAKSVTDARNAYAHFTEKNKDRIPESSELIEIAWLVEKVLTTVVLRYLEFSDLELVHSFKNGRVSDRYM